MKSYNCTSITLFGVSARLNIFDINFQNIVSMLQTSKHSPYLTTKHNQPTPSRPTGWTLWTLSDLRLKLKSEPNFKPQIIQFVSSVRFHFRHGCGSDNQPALMLPSISQSFWTELWSCGLGELVGPDKLIEMSESQRNDSCCITES